MLPNISRNIAQYLKKYRQLENGIWSVNRIYYDKQFSWKIMHEMGWRRYSQTLFLKIKIEYIFGTIV